MTTTTIPDPQHVMLADCMETVESDGFRLIVTARMFGHAADRGMTNRELLSAICAHTASAIEVTMTEDGRAFISGWHEGPEANWVRAERWTPAGRTFHGWIDSVSRRILQAG